MDTPKDYARSATFDKPPATLEELKSFRVEIRGQLEELHNQSRGGKLDRITCPCRARPSVNYAWRCYHCGIFFCHTCAERHFGPGPALGLIEEEE